MQYARASTIPLGKPRFVFYCLGGEWELSMRVADFEDSLKQFVTGLSFRHNISKHCRFNNKAAGAKRSIIDH